MTCLERLKRHECPIGNTFKECPAECRGCKYDDIAAGDCRAGGDGFVTSRFLGYELGSYGDQSLFAEKECPQEICVSLQSEPLVNVSRMAS